jgi:HK97 gp10 family phage protein
MSFSIEQKGLKDVKSALGKLPEELRKAAQSAVLRAGGKPILKQEKALVPVADGLLKKSLGIMLIGKRGGPKTTAKIGVRKGYKGRSLGFKTTTKGRNKGKTTERFQDPSKYGHLVEFGTSHSAAQPFIRPAIDAAQNQTVDAMAAGLDKHLTRVAARLRKNR